MAHKKLKVFAGNVNGIMEALVSASTKTEAASLFGVSMHTFNSWYHETGNIHCVEVALADPGTVFERKIGFDDNGWTKRG